MEAIYLLRKLMGYYHRQLKDSHMVFIDFEMAHNRVPIEVLCEVFVEEKSLYYLYLTRQEICVMES